MATKNVIRSIFNINSAQIGGWWVKDATNSGLLSGVLYVSPAYFKENRGSFVIRGSHGSQKAVEKLDGATFGDITIAKGSRDGDLQAFILSSPSDSSAEGIFQIDALFAESDGVNGVTVSSTDITDATEAGRSILTAADIKTIKALLALVAADITDAGAAGLDCLKAKTGGELLKGMRVTDTFAAMMLTNFPSAAQKTAFCALIGAQPAA